MSKETEKIFLQMHKQSNKASIVITDLLYLLGSVPFFITFMNIQLK